MIKPAPIAASPANRERDDDTRTYGAAVHGDGMAFGKQDICFANAFSQPPIK